MQLAVSIFANAGTVPLEIAASEGFFAREGLEVTVTPTTSSVHQMTGVVDGVYQIAATAIDNVIAYNMGQGAAPTRDRSDLVVFMGSATYRLPFVVAPGIAGFADLRDRVIGVDAVSTGFAFLLREMLQINGLGPGDYSFVPVGAPPERWQALADGKVAGALLNDHLAAIAAERGCHVLSSDPDPWDSYQGNAFCAQRSFLQAAPAAVDGFVRAVLRAVDFTLDPVNHVAVARALVAHMGMTPDRAAAVAGRLQAPGSILRRGLPVSRIGTQEVIRLREIHAGSRFEAGIESLFDRRLSVVA